MLRATATAVPTHDAIVYLDRRISYEELYRSVRAGADGLRLHGVGPGDTVLLALTNCPEFVMVYFATALLHAKVYAIDPNAAEPELRRCIRDAEPALVVTHAMRAGTFQRLLAERADLRAKIAVVGGERGTHLLAADLFATTATAAAAPSPPHDGDWSVTYSSGSTGTPKRICRTQRNQVAEAGNLASTAGIGPDDRMLCVVPLFHALGQFCCMIASARSGATLVLLEQTGPPGQEGDQQLVLGSRIDRVLEMIEKHQVTIMPAVPYIYELLADVGEDVPADVSSVRLFLSGGNFLPAATAARFQRRYGAPIRQTYGSSEAGSVAWDCHDPGQAVAGSVGHPLNGVEVRLVDPARQPLPPGSVGEVAVRGPSVMTGYDGRPDLTAQVMSDGFYHTGDVGMIDEDGRLHITGRINLLIDTGGRKVNPLEVEAVLAEHDRVREAVVTGVGTRGGDEVLVAVVVPDTDSGVSGDGSDELADALLDFCRARLTDYKVPHRVVFRDALPRSPLGKVLRRDLDLGEEPATAPAVTAAQTEDRIAETTAYLVGLLSRLLHKPADRIDVSAPILSTGLNSLVAMQLRVAIERDLGVPAQLGTLLSARSLTDVAARLTDPAQSGAALLPTADLAEFPLSAAQLPHVDAPRAVHTLTARLGGPVDEAVLRAAFQELVDRHPALRLTVVRSGDGPAQRIEPRADVDFAAEDVPHDGLRDRVAALAEDAGPLRVRLLRDGGPAPVLAVVAHRLAADRWSLAVLLRDLAMMLGDGTYLPSLPFTYRDFVQWSAEQGHVASPAPHRGSAVGTTELTLDPALTEGLRQAARRDGVSVQSLLHTALADGHRVATVDWGRDRPEFGDLVGRFARVVPAPAASPADRPDVLFVDDIGPRPALAHLMRFVAGVSDAPVAVGDLRLHPVALTERPLAAPVECRVTRVGDHVSLLWRHEAGVPVDQLVARFHAALGAVAAQTAETR